MKKKSCKKKIFKGFTLVELLAVIVILAIIMIIAIPAVLNTMESAKKKTFIEYTQKCFVETQKQFLIASQMNKLEQGVYTQYVYSIKDDLGLSNTGDYFGVVLVTLDSLGAYKYSITLINKDFILFDSRIDKKEVSPNDLIKRGGDLEKTLLSYFKLINNNINSFDDITKVDMINFMISISRCNTEEVSFVDPISNTIITTVESHRDRWDTGECTEENNNFEYILNKLPENTR